MSLNEKRSSSFIIGARHAGRSLITSIKTYSSILQMNVIGKMSNAHKKALKVVFDCCDIPGESWTTLSELIEQNDDEKVMQILSEEDQTGQSYLERNFVTKSIASIEVARNASKTILQEDEKLTDEQRFYVETIYKHCQREIEIWKDISEYYS